MSRKLPQCAFCGHTLVHKGRILMEFEGYYSTPVVGWHKRCVKKDKPTYMEVLNSLLEDNFKSVLPIPLLLIFTRGEDRLSLLQPFYDCFEIELDSEGNPNVRRKKE